MEPDRKAVNEFAGSAGEHEKGKIGDDVGDVAYRIAVAILVGPSQGATMRGCPSASMRGN